MRLLRNLILPCSALIALGAGTSTAVAAPTPGLQLPPVSASGGHARVDREIASASRLGVKLVRVELRWSDAEPRQGQFDAPTLSALDYTVKSAGARGIKVLVTIDRTPCWASMAPASTKRACTATDTPLSVSRWQPTDPASVTGIFAAVAQRYGTALAGIEVWNEPDQANELYFKGPDKSTKYVAVLQAAYKAIKAVNPGITVLGASIVGYNGVFLQNMYNKGAKGYFDALDVHYYDLVLNSLRSIRSVMTKNGDASPVWLGEFGFSSCAPKHVRQGPHRCLTKTEQGRALSDVFASLKNTSWVRAGVVYSLYDEPGLSFGLQTAAGKDKPAFKAMQRITKGKARVRSTRVRLRSRGGRTVVSGSGPAADIFQMEVRKGGTLRFRATFRLTTKATYKITLPKVLGTHGLSVKVFQLWNHKAVTRHN